MGRGRDETLAVSLLPSRTPVSPLLEAPAQLGLFAAVTDHVVELALGVVEIPGRAVPDNLIRSVCTVRREEGCSYSRTLPALMTTTTS